MSDAIGYVTLEQANTYIATHYISTDPLRVEWSKLSDADKSALLLKSFETIELLPFTGRKADPSQPNAFPRWPYQEVPNQILYAQIENALSLSDTSATDEAAHYGRLWQFGVNSYSIGDLSEHISEGAWSSGSTSSAASGIVSIIATRLLKPFLVGNYRIIGGRCK